MVPIQELNALGTNANTSHILANKVNQSYKGTRDIAQMLSCRFASLNGL